MTQDPSPVEQSGRREENLHVLVEVRGSEAIPTEIPDGVTVFICDHDEADELEKMGEVYSLKTFRSPIDNSTLGPQRLKGRLEDRLREIDGTREEMSSLLDHLPMEDAEELGVALDSLTYAVGRIQDKIEEVLSAPHPAPPDEAVEGQPPGRSRPITRPLAPEVAIQTRDHEAYWSAETQTEDRLDANVVAYEGDEQEAVRRVKEACLGLGVDPPFGFVVHRSEGADELPAPGQAHDSKPGLMSVDAIRHVVERLANSSHVRFWIGYNYRPNGLAPREGEPALMAFEAIDVVEDGPGGPLRVGPARLEERELRRMGFAKERRGACLYWVIRRADDEGNPWRADLGWGGRIWRGSGS